MHGPGPGRDRLRRAGRYSDPAPGARIVAPADHLFSDADPAGPARAVCHGGGQHAVPRHAQRHDASGGGYGRLRDQRRRRPGLRPGMVRFPQGGRVGDRLGHVHGGVCGRGVDFLVSAPLPSVRARGGASLALDAPRRALSPQGGAARRADLFFCGRPGISPCSPSWGPCRKTA